MDRIDFRPELSGLDNPNIPKVKVSCLRDGAPQKQEEDTEDCVWICPGCDKIGTLVGLGHFPVRQELCLCYRLAVGCHDAMPHGADKTHCI